VGAVEEGFREPGGGGGFFPIGGGGPFIDAIEDDESGLGRSAPDVFRRWAMEACRLGVLAAPGTDGRPGMAGAAPMGGLGAVMVGGFGADLDDGSGSERYVASRFAVQVVRKAQGEQAGRVLTSGIDASACLPQFRHPPGEKAAKLWCAIHARDSGLLPVALVTITSRSEPGDWRREGARSLGKAGDSRRPSQRRWAGPAGALDDYGRRSIICDSLLKRSAFADVCEESSLVAAG
jgi:hypothetical protein